MLTARFTRFPIVGNRPGGETSDNPGSFLEIVPQSRIVWTTALVANWRPAAEPWMPLTAFITFEDEAAGTRYVATVLHKDKATRDSPNRWDSSMDGEPASNSLNSTRARCVSRPQPASGCSEHELPDRSAHRHQLRAAHAADDPA